MSGRVRRRRAAVLFCLAVASGGLAASSVQNRVREVEAAVGPLVPVLVARADLEPDTKLDPERVERLLAVREVPERFAPPGALTAPEEAVGFRTAVPVSAGSYVTAALLGEAEGRREPGAPLGPGERAAEVAVAGGDSLGALGPGGLVDVIVTTEPRTGAGRTYVALESVELLGVRPADAAVGGASGEAAAGDGGGTLATLRVSPTQAVFLTAAQNFAREVRLLARAPGDRRRVGPVAVDGRRSLRPGSSTPVAAAAILAYIS